MTAAFDVYAKIESDPFYSEENQSALRKAIADYIEGRNYHEHDLIEVL